MAQLKAMRGGPAIILLVLLIIALIFGGFLWFDFLGFISAREVVTPILTLLRLRRPDAGGNPDSPFLLDEQRLALIREELALREEELNGREQGIGNLETALEERQAALAERETALEDREKSFNDRVNQYDDKVRNLRQASQYYVGMQPAQAVERLQAMADQDVIDILRMTETIAQESGATSVVSYWLSLMSAERAADLSRKMIKKPEA
ncbi:MAG: flagellar protein FlbB [Spirochaetales bacterium]|jgi:flagellar protein FlbB|nr:flagellar protein FlbB [Spirochaetales bacterium]